MNKKELQRFHLKVQLFGCTFWPGAWVFRVCVCVCVCVCFTSVVVSGLYLCVCMFKIINQCDTSWVVVTVHNINFTTVNKQTPQGERFVVESPTWPNPFFGCLLLFVGVIGCGVCVCVCCVCVSISGWMWYSARDAEPTDAYIREPTTTRRVTLLLSIGYAPLPLGKRWRNSTNTTEV